MLGDVSRLIPEKRAELKKNPDINKSFPRKYLNSQTIQTQKTKSTLANSNKPTKILFPFSALLTPQFYHHRLQIRMTRLCPFRKLTVRIGQCPCSYHLPRAFSGDRQLSSEDFPTADFAPALKESLDGMSFYLV